MNRRNFIGTLAAFAGVVLAKIKAPAAPKYVAGLDPAAGYDHLFIYSYGDFREDFNLYAKHIYVQDMYGRYKWEPTETQKRFFEHHLKRIDKPAE